MKSLVSDSEFSWCSPDAHVGEYRKLRVRDLSPTQFATGRAEVLVRAARLRKTLVKDLGFDAYRSLAWIVREHHGYAKNDVPFSEFKWENFFRPRILLGQDILAERHTFDDFVFAVDENGRLEVRDHGREVLEEALFLASSPEARGLRGYQGRM